VPDRIVHRFRQAAGYSLICGRAAAWVASEYPPGKKVTDAELAEVNIQRHKFHGEWSYTILPSGNGTVIS